MIGLLKRYVPCVLLVGLLLGPLCPAIALAETEQARRAYDEATAAFGLGHYEEAAKKYEEAFALRPDPALLYNAAQSYRQAGITPRAIELDRRRDKGQAYH